jgi:hypothetical protein
MFAVQTNVLFRRFINNTADNLDKLLKRKVDVRFVIESPEGIVQPDTDLERFLEMDNFRVRFFKGKIQACILLHDNTDAFMSTSLDTIHTPSYWSNNPCVIAIVRDYFEGIGGNRLKSRVCWCAGVVAGLGCLVWCELCVFVVLTKSYILF